MLEQTIGGYCLMKLSVLLPTRRRYKRCIQSLHTLIENSSSENDIEVLMAFDDDDLDTMKKCQEYIEKNFKDIETKYKVTERYSYVHLNKYINDLCSIATGDWLVFWSDDVLMETKNWDKEIEKFKDDFLLLSPRVKNRLDYKGTMFPIVPKLWYDELGHFSLNCHNDTWVEEVARKLGIFKFIPIYVDHIRRKIMDSTAKERVEDTKNFWSSRNEKLRTEDADKLRKFVNG